MSWTPGRNLFKEEETWSITMRGVRTTYVTAERTSPVVLATVSRRGPPKPPLLTSNSAKLSLILSDVSAILPNAYERGPSA